MHPLTAPLQCHARGPADVDIIAYPPPKKKNADIRRYPLDCLSALMSVDTRWIVDENVERSTPPSQLPFGFDVG